MNLPETELAFLHQWAGWFCHQLPERSPRCGGDVFPVCFRCAGLEFGLGAAYLGLFFSGGWRRQFPSVRVVIRLAAMIVPLMLDGLGNALGLWASPGWWRGMTGLAAGLSLPWLLAPLAQPLAGAGDPARQPALENLRPLFWLALPGIIAVGWLDYGCGPVLFRIFAATASLGWFLFLVHFLLALVRAYGSGMVRRLFPFSSEKEVNP